MITLSLILSVAALATAVATAALLFREYRTLSVGIIEALSATPIEQGDEDEFELPIRDGTPEVESTPLIQEKAAFYTDHQEFELELAQIEAGEARRYVG